MKISINTETEEIEELRHAIAIMEDAIKRRENPEFYEEQEEQQEMETSQSEIQQQESTTESMEQQEEQEQEEQGEQIQQRTPEVDMSSLATSDYGQEKENRRMGNLTQPQPAQQEEPQQDNKSLVKDLIMSIRNQTPGQPIQMSEIINRAQEKNITEEETRNLVSELQREGSI